MHNNKQYRYKILIIILLGAFATLAQSYVNHSSGLHLQLPDKLIDIKAQDVEQLATFQTAPGQVAVMLQLKPARAIKLMQLTKNAVGQCALWIWNGRVLCAEKLTAPVDKNVIIRDFSFQEAEQFRQQTSL